MSLAMSGEAELASDSDQDDEDYVPEGGDCEALSEVESDGDAESAPEDDNDDDDESRVQRSSRDGKQATKRAKRRASKKVKKKDEEETGVTATHGNDEAKTVVSEEEEKKRADSLWADFMKDTGTVPKRKPAVAAKTSVDAATLIVRPKVEEKVKITKIFEFAGEEVKVEQQVDADSAEARLSLSSVAKDVESPATASSRGRGGKRTAAGLGGISSVLGQIGKKAKISTLEKSKLDWNNFKREEKIDEEINTHNRGKDGYLERQDFLQRADLRRFEIEKQMRLSRRNTR